MFRLAWQYIRFHRLQSAILVASIVLTIGLPVALELLLRHFDRQLVARAESTPLACGARGSQVDLTLGSIYLRDRNLPLIRFGDFQSLDVSGVAVPLHLNHSAQDIPVVGTTIQYFKARSLKPARGTLFRRLGECVIGSQVAASRGLSVGDEIKTDRTSSIDIASNPPLYLTVIGILETTNTADDRAVFVDLKTTWVLDGHGHGHDDLSATTDPALILQRDDQSTIASAAVVGALRITPDNITSFHFHGSVDQFPISAILVWPQDELEHFKLLGRFQSPEAPLQIVEPPDVVRELMGLIFRVKKFFDANMLLVALATLLLLGLVVLLSLKLRRQEMATMFKIGSNRGTVFKLIAAEWLILFAAAALVISALLGVISVWAPSIVQRLVA